MVILTCNLIAGVSGHSQIASFSPRLVSSSRCQRRSQGGSEVPLFSSQEAKPEAGSVVVKLENRFPNLKNKDLNLDVCQERQHFVIKFLIQLSVKIVSLLRAGIGPSTWGSILH